MIWGVGTGRCGTKSLAMQLKGEHEPKPWLEHEPAHYARGILSSVDKLNLLANLKDRSRLITPIIVDLKHSYVMDLIEKVDPDAAFIYLVRNPFDCIASFILGGAFTDQDQQGNDKLQPKPGYSAGVEVSRLLKTTWFWRETNKRIMDHFLVSNRPFAVLYTEELATHANIYSKKDFTFTREEATNVCNFTSNIWARAQILHNDSHISKKYNLHDYLDERGIEL